MIEGRGKKARKEETEGKREGERGSREGTREKEWGREEERMEGRLELQKRVRGIKGREVWGGRKDKRKMLQVSVTKA